MDDTESFLCNALNDIGMRYCSGRACKACVFKNIPTENGSKLEGCGLNGILDAIRKVEDTLGVAP